MSFKDEMKDLNYKVEHQEDPVAKEIRLQVDRALSAIKDEIRECIAKGETVVSKKKRSVGAFRYDKTDFVTIEVRNSWTKIEVEWIVTNATKIFLKKLKLAAAEEEISITNYCLRLRYWSDGCYESAGDYVCADCGILKLPKKQWGSSWEKWGSSWEIKIYCDYQFSI